MAISNFAILLTEGAADEYMIYAMKFISRWIVCGAIWFVLIVSFCATIAPKIAETDEDDPAALKKASKNISIRILLFIAVLPYLPVMIPIQTGFYFRNIHDRREYEKEKARYEKKREDILSRIRKVLSEKGQMEVCPGKTDACIAYMPDGKVMIIDLVCDAKEFLCGRDPADIQPEDNLDSMLMSADAMIIKAGEHKNIAADKIAERTRDKCGTFRGMHAVYSSGSNYLIGIGDDGKTAIITFDLPAEILFTGFKGTVRDADDISIYLLNKAKDAESVINALNRTAAS